MIDMFGGRPRGEPNQHFEECHHIAGFRASESADLGAAMEVESDDTFRAQESEGLSDCSSARLEFAREVRFYQTLPADIAAEIETLDDVAKDLL